MAEINTIIDQITHWGLTGLWKLVFAVIIWFVGKKVISISLRLLKKIFDKNLQYFNIKKLSFKTLSHQQIIEIYQKTKSVLDINNPFQNGLTIRTFEVLALGKKLITTNADVINYPFYHPQNILIINRENIILEKFFFETEFKEIENEILQKMSLESFIECLFIENQDEYWENSNKKAIQNF